MTNRSHGREGATRGFRGRDAPWRVSGWHDACFQICV
jgi:hypothetical protein